MPDTPATELQLHKRQRNLIFFSMAVLILGWAPETMRTSFTFLGINFANIDPTYMWGWATAISIYLYLAWISTARTEDQWLFLGGKIRNLFFLRDFFWLQYITWRNAHPHGFSSSLLGGEDNELSTTINVKTYYRMMKDSDIYHAITNEGERLVDIKFCQTHLNRPSSSGGYLLRLHIGEYNNKPFYCVAKPHSTNPYQTARELKTQLYFSVCPPVILGALALMTSGYRFYNLQ